MTAENVERNGCLQRDSAEHKEYTERYVRCCERTEASHPFLLNRSVDLALSVLPSASAFAHAVFVKAPAGDYCKK